MGFFDWVSDVASGGGDVFTDWLEAIQEAAEEAAEDIEDAGEDFVEDMNDTWNNASRDGGFFGVVGGLLGTFGSLVDLGADVVGAVRGGVVTVVIDTVGLGAGLLVTLVSPDAGKAVAGAIFDFGAQAGEFVDKVHDYFGNVVEWFFGLLASGAFWLASWMHCARGEVRGQQPPAPRGFDDVDHIFVLMLENRSFDHMLGHLGLKGVGDLADTRSNVDLEGRDVRTSSNARLKLFADPRHSFHAIDRQTTGGAAMTGFAADWHAHLREVYEGNAPSNVNVFAGPPPEAEIAQVMAGFSRDRVPIIAALAEQFVVCTNWFSSVPGPTYPNRLFAYAGTSGGLAGDPDVLALGGAYADGINFDNGHLFYRLDQQCISWRIYHGDRFPMANTLSGINTSHVGDHRVVDPIDGDRDDFAKDLRDADSFFPAFVFIEPDYGRVRDHGYESGNSQHPWGAVPPGERLIKHVYEQLRASKIWERSMLIVTYDEHGGFYDHVVPPKAVPPGDTEWHDDLNPVAVNDPQPADFKFDRLGVRVPAIVISPLLPSQHTFDAACDHTTIIRTVCDRFKLESFTARDAAAPSLRELFLDAIRGTPVLLPEVHVQ
jgi:phospholipase C